MRDDWRGDGRMPVSFRPKASGGGGGGPTLPEVASATLLLNLQADVGVESDTVLFAGTGLITQSGNTVTYSGGDTVKGEVKAGDRILADDSSIDGIVTGIHPNLPRLTLDTTAEVAVGVTFTVHPQAGTARVNAWRDQSGNHLDVTSTGTARPAIRTVAGYQAICGDDIDDVLEGSTSAIDNLASFAVFGVWYWYVDGAFLISGQFGVGTPITKVDSDSGIGWSISSQGFAGGVWQDNDNQAAASMTVPESGAAFNVFTWEKISRTEEHYYVDGSNAGEVSTHTGNPTNYGNAAPIRIGQMYGTSDFGMHRANMIYVPAPNATDRQAIIEWLAAKYGITLPF